MNIHLILHTIGNLTIFLAGILLAPLGIAIFSGDEAEIRAFLMSIAAAGIIGSILKFMIKCDDSSLGVREGFGIVTFGWLICALFGAIPYWHCGICGFSDAYFESMSGFTTTGASIFGDVEALSRSILFWRSLTQWVGGMGIIVFFVAFLPALKVGAYQLFSAETSGPKTDKIKPRVAETAKMLWFIYLAISGLLFVFLIAGGMLPFDAVCHTFGAVSTGGFSTMNYSVADFNSLYIEIVLMVFMFLCGCNFALFYQCVYGKRREILKNSELRFFVCLLLSAIIIITLFMYFSESQAYHGKIKDDNYSSFFGSLRYASFQVVSIYTTTGYCSADFDLWPDICRFVLVLTMVFGGCAGSTSGGMKNIRILMLIKFGLRELERLIRPNVVKHIKIDKMSIDENIIKIALGFFVSYICIIVLCFLILISLKTEVITALTAVITCLGGVGPGLDGVGAVKNFAHLPVAGKWVLIFCMLAGRLEIYGVFVMFLPITWKR